MTKNSNPKQTKSSPMPKATSQNAQIDPGAVLAALRNAEDKNAELTDLIARLNRNLRQLEEQNRVIIEQLQEQSKK